MKFYSWSPGHMYWGRAGFIHAWPDGGPVLIEQSSWRTIAGVYFRILGRTHWVQFRRFQ